jgi:hypothetical protein
VSRSKSACRQTAAVSVTFTALALTLSSASCNLSADMLEMSTSSAAGQAACSSVLSHWRPDTSALVVCGVAQRPCQWAPHLRHSLCNALSMPRAGRGKGGVGRARTWCTAAPPASVTELEPVTEAVEWKTSRPPRPRVRRWWRRDTRVPRLTRGTGTPVRRRTSAFRRRRLATLLVHCRQERGGSEWQAPRCAWDAHTFSGKAL